MSDCLIIGGGVIGMMSARTLAISGASVTLIDQRACGKESSWAGGGIISPLYPWLYSNTVNELSMASQKIYEDLCATLLEDTGIDTEYLRSGLLMMDEYDSYEAIDWMQDKGVHYQSHPQGALFSEVAQVRNPRLLKALKSDIVNRGVKIVEFTKVNELIIEKDKVLGVITENKHYHADHTIVCGGAWSSTLMENSNEIYPIKGQMIVLKSEPDTIPHIILEQGKYIIPRKDGHILIGSTTEDVGFDRSTNPNIGLSLRDYAIRHFPKLYNATLTHHWSGFRPASKSGVIIKKQQEGLYINTGHLRNGLNMAPESANRLQQLIENSC